MLLFLFILAHPSATQLGTWMQEGHLDLSKWPFVFLNEFIFPI